MKMKMTRTLCVPICYHWVVTHTDDVYSAWCIQLDLLFHAPSHYMMMMCVHSDNVQCACMHWTCARYHCELCMHIAYLLASFMLLFLLQQSLYSCTTCCHHISPCCCLCIFYWSFTCLPSYLLLFMYALLSLNVCNFITPTTNTPVELPENSSLVKESSSALPCV